MQHGKYVYRSDFALRYLGEGRKQGLKQGLKEGRKEGRHEGRLEAMRMVLLRLAWARFRISGGELRRPIEACGDLARLTALFSKLEAAPDRQAARQLVAELERNLARPARHRARRTHTTRAPRAPRARAGRR